MPQIPRKPVGSGDQRSSDRRRVERPTRVWGSDYDEVAGSTYPSGPNSGVSSAQPTSNRHGHPCPFSNYEDDIVLAGPSSGDSKTPLRRAKAVAAPASKNPFSRLVAAGELPRSNNPFSWLRPEASDGLHRSNAVTSRAQSKGSSSPSTAGSPGPRVHTQKIDRGHDKIPRHHGAHAHPPRRRNTTKEVSDEPRYSWAEGDDCHMLAPLRRADSTSSSRSSSPLSARIDNRGPSRRYLLGPPSVHVSSDVDITNMHTGHHSNVHHPQVVSSGSHCSRRSVKPEIDVASRGGSVRHDGNGAPTSRFSGARFADPDELDLAKWAGREERREERRQDGRKVKRGAEAWYVFR